MRTWQIWAIVAICFVAVVAAGLYVKLSDRKPGDPAVYDRIATTTDCAELREIDEAALADMAARGNNTAIKRGAAYSDAANARMEQLGC